MPKQGGNFVGLFGSYPDADIVEGGAFPDDEEAISTAADEMFSMCGNAGQETLIGDYLADFEEWAYDVLETEGGSEDSWQSFVNMVVDDYYGSDLEKWQGTSQIWRAGYDIVASQFGFHDSHDEYGEGTGR